MTALGRNPKVKLPEPSARGEPAHMRNRTMVVRGDKAPVLEYNARSGSWLLWIEYDSAMQNGTYLILRRDGSILSQKTDGLTVQVAPKPR